MPCMIMSCSGMTGNLILERLLCEIANGLLCHPFLFGMLIVIAIIYGIYKSWKNR